MGSQYHAQAIRPDTAYIKKIIESSLLADWAIRIEYHHCASDADDWQLWDQAHFAVRSASPIIEALLQCYSKQPGSIIRICAEKFRPQTRMVYTVYNPQYLTDQTECNAPANIRQVARRYAEPATISRLTPP